jgi:hypothetical protein
MQGFATITMLETSGFWNICMQGFATHDLNDWNIWKRDDHNAGEAFVLINFHEHLFARMAAKDSFL